MRIIIGWDRLEIFKYAKEKGIDIVVPNNILKLRNQVKSLKTCLEV